MIVNGKGSINRIHLPIYNLILSNHFIYGGPSGTTATPKVARISGDPPSEIEKVDPTIYRVTTDKQIEFVKQGNVNYPVIDYNCRPGKVGKYGALLKLY